MIPYQILHALLGFAKIRNSWSFSDRSGFWTIEKLKTFFAGNLRNDRQLTLFSYLKIILKQMELVKEINIINFHV